MNSCNNLFVKKDQNKINKQKKFISSGNKKTKQILLFWFLPRFLKMNFHCITEGIHSNGQRIQHFNINLIVLQLYQINLLMNLIKLVNYCRQFIIPGLNFSQLIRNFHLSFGNLLFKMLIRNLLSIFPFLVGHA